MLSERTVGELEARTEDLLRRAGVVTVELKQQTDELVAVLALLRSELFGRQGMDSGTSQERRDG